MRAPALADGGVGEVPDVSQQAERRDRDAARQDHGARDSEPAAEAAGQSVSGL